MTDEVIERFDLASPSPVEERLLVLRSAFPDVFREGRVDFDALRRELGDWVDPGPERFGLTWPGKAECMRVIQEPSIGTLVPLPEESVDWETTQNVIIEGENLEVAQAPTEGVLRQGQGHLHRSAIQHWEGVHLSRQLPRGPHRLPSVLRAGW